MASLRCAVRSCAYVVKCAEAERDTRRGPPDVVYIRQNGDRWDLVQLARSERVSSACRSGSTRSSGSSSKGIPRSCRSRPREPTTLDVFFSFSEIFPELLRDANSLKLPERERDTLRERVRPWRNTTSNVVESIVVDGGNVDSRVNNEEARPGKWQEIRLQI